MQQKQHELLCDTGSMSYECKNVIPVVLKLTMHLFHNNLGFIEEGRRRRIIYMDGKFCWG